MRKLLMIAGGVILLLVVAMVAMAVLVDVDRYRPDAEKQASEALGRQVTIGKLKSALLAGGVTAENLTIADDPRFSNEPFLSAGSMNIGVDLKELIFRRKLKVKSFLIHAPKLNLVQNSEGQWNYSSLAKNTSNSTASSEGGPPEFTVGKFTLDDGDVTIHHLASGKTSDYSKLRMEATGVSLASSFPYELSATAPSGGTIDIKGIFGPVAQQSEHTPVTATVTVKNFDIATAGFTDPGSPLKGLVDIDANIKSDGARADIDANIIGHKMCLAEGCTPSPKPIEIHTKASYLLTDDLADLSSSKIKLGSSTANLSGTISLKGAKPHINASVEAAALAVSDIESVLPALGIVLPPGAKLEGGTASVRASVVGPPDALVVKGHVGLADSKVTGYDLGSHLSGLTKLAGVHVGKETVIQHLSADVLKDPAGSKVDNLTVVVPATGTFTGGGTISKHNDLDFAMKGELNISKGAVGQVGSLFGNKTTNLDVPFHITGTTSDPKFTSDMGSASGIESVGAMAGNAAGKGAQGLTKGLSGLGGLFGKKN